MGKGWGGGGGWGTMEVYARNIFFLLCSSLILSTACSFNVNEAEYKLNLNANNYNI